MESLSLSIPVQHNYSDPTVERDVLRLHDWLTNLPLMDVVETVRLVLGALDALNEQKLGHEERFQFLEAYHATAQRLFVTVDPLHLRQLALTKLQRQEAIDGVERLFLSVCTPSGNLCFSNSRSRQDYCPAQHYRLTRRVYRKMNRESSSL